MNGFSAGYEKCHKEIHQQDKEHGIGVNGGNTRLHKVHKIGGKNEGRTGSHSCAGKQLFHKT